jgi:hypothetical protein
MNLMTKHDFPQTVVDAARDSGIDDDIPDFTTRPKLPEVDRSTLENYATCPLMAWMLGHRKVLNATVDTDSGQEAHDVFANVTAEYIAAQGSLNQRDLYESVLAYAMQSRPDVQPLVIEAVRRAAWDWSVFLGSMTPTAIMRHDGGKGERSGQIGVDIPSLGICATTELDLLYAGASRSLLHVVDYKTGRAHWTAEMVKNAFQFQMQGWLTLENYPDAEAVEVRIWNTRTNKLTYAIEIERRDLPAIEQRVYSAARLYAEHHDKKVAEHVTATPNADKCGMCRAAIKCHATPLSDVDRDPEAFVRAMQATTAKLAAMEKAASEYVEKTGRDIVASNGIAFGVGKPKVTETKPSLYITTPGGIPAQHKPPVEVAHDTLIGCGATHKKTSDSGSRYYVMPNGRDIRVSDHKANAATSEWMKRNDVGEVRIDRTTWRKRLAELTS